MKRTIAAILIMLIPMLMISASASTAGSAADPLITLSHLEGTFAVLINAEIVQLFRSIEDGASSKLSGADGGLYGVEEYEGYSFAPNFSSISLFAGDVVILPMGGSFVLLSGAAELTIANGAVIDVSIGEEAASGTPLTRYRRYFSTEDTIATITANSASTGHIDGFYRLESAVIFNQHPVFNDVTERDWFYQAVDAVYSMGLFQGATETIFSPYSSMTRGMFVTVLHRLAGEPYVDAQGKFADMPSAEAYYYNAAAWTNENNIVLGYDDGTFRPDSPVTREQMATIMHRFAAYELRDVSVNESVFKAFHDSGDVSEYASAAMRWAIAWGIINGSNGMLLPRNTATRAEVAQIMSNYISNIMAQP